MVKLGKDEECFFASLRLLNACLSWDFSRFGGFGKNGARGVENENGTTTNNNNNNSKGGRSVLENASISDGFVPVTPGETWREILLQSGENNTFAWLFSLHETMHSPNGVAQNSADGSSAILPGTKVAKETRSLLSNLLPASAVLRTRLLD